jgi:hypothetical protein
MSSTYIDARRLVLVIFVVELVVVLVVPTLPALMTTADGRSNRHRAHTPW